MPPLSPTLNPFQHIPDAHDEFIEVCEGRLLTLAQTIEGYLRKGRELSDLWQRVAYLLAVLEGNPTDTRERGESVKYLSDRTQRDLDTLLEQLSKPGGVFDTLLAEARARLTQLTGELAAACEPVHEFAPEHAAALSLVLQRTRVYTRRVKPTEVRRYTGKFGRSLVYHFLYGDNYWVAKFDEPDRAEGEWAAIELLRRELNVRPTDTLTVVVSPLADDRGGVVLPVADNRVGDGVILSRAAGHPAADKTVRLDEYLARHLFTQPDLCRAALAHAAAVLTRFHHFPKAAPVFSRNGNGKGNCWGAAFFQTLSGEAEAARSNAAAVWPDVSWEAETVRLDGSPSGWPNPFRRYAAVAAEPTGPILVSRVHGDTNLGNLLVSVAQDQTALAVWLIDLARSGAEQPTAFDYAWLEIDCWQTLLPALVPVTPDNLPQLTESFALARRYLDGKDRTLSAGCAIPAPFVECVMHVRRLAARALQHPAAGSTYALRDFFHCLAFTYLWAAGKLSLPGAVGVSDADRPKGEWNLRTAVIGAAVSFDAIAAIDDAEYGSGKRRRPWEDDPR